MLVIICTFNYVQKADDTVDEEAIANYCMMYSEFLVPDNYLVSKDDNILSSQIDMLTESDAAQVSKWRKTTMSLVFCCSRCLIFGGLADNILILI